MVSEDNSNDTNYNNNEGSEQLFDDDNALWED
jgi:hypothetical protein